MCPSPTKRWRRPTTRCSTRVAGCCRCWSLVSLLRLFTVVPLLVEEFPESAYLKPDRPTEWDEADRTITAVSHVVRPLYLLLSHLAGEVKLPAAGLERLVCELCPCTYATLRKVFKHVHRRPGSMLGARFVFSHGMSFSGWESKPESWVRLSVQRASGARVFGLALRWWHVQ